MCNLTDVNKYKKDCEYPKNGPIQIASGAYGWVLTSGFLNLALKKESGDLDMRILKACDDRVHTDEAWTRFAHSMELGLSSFARSASKCKFGRLGDRAKFDDIRAAINFTISERMLV